MRTTSISQSQRMICWTLDSLSLSRCQGVSELHLMADVPFLLSWLAGNLQHF